MIRAKVLNPFERAGRTDEVGGIERAERECAATEMPGELAVPGAEGRAVEDDPFDRATGDRGAGPVGVIVGVAERAAEAKALGGEEADHLRTGVDEGVPARLRGGRAFVADHAVEVREALLGRVAFTVGEHQIVGRDPDPAAGEERRSAEDPRLLDHERGEPVSVGGERGRETSGARPGDDDVRAEVAQDSVQGP